MHTKMHNKTKLQIRDELKEIRNQKIWNIDIPVFYIEYLTDLTRDLKYFEGTGTWLEWKFAATRIDM